MPEADPSPAAWLPDPSWEPLPGGLGPSTVGVWRAGDQVVKRLCAPGEDDPAELTDRRHFAWWRRPAEVARTGLVESTPGLRALPATAEEDATGLTLWSPVVEPAENAGLFLAHCLGEFAGAGLPEADWLATGHLRSRLTRIERRGGWPTLARTTVADVADFLWQRRGHHLDALDALPQVPLHGDPTPGNLLGRDADTVVAIDWSTLGTGPVGADVGYLALAAREDFDHLLTAYVDALPPGIADRDQALLGARVVTVYTALSRAEWALARVADGAGALAGKYRHPSVAPYLRSMQRQFPQIEALLGT